MTPADDHGAAPDSFAIDDDRPHDTPAYRAMLAEVAASDPRGPYISLDAMRKWVASWGTDNELPMPEPE